MCRLAISPITVNSQKYRSKPSRLVDQRPIGAVGVRGQLLHRFDEFRARRRFLRMQQRDLQHRRDQVVEVLPAKLGIEIFAGDDLALLGDADAGLHGAGRLRQDGVVARAAAAADRPAAAVEQPQADLAALEDVDQRHLGLVELPARGQEAAVLVAVGIADHHLLHAAAAFQQARVVRDGRRANP